MLDKLYSYQHYPTPPSLFRQVYIHFALPVFAFRPLVTPSHALLIKCSIDDEYLHFDTLVLHACEVNESQSPKRYLGASDCDRKKS